MSELPLTWTEAAIGELCDLINGRAFKPTDWTESGLPIVRIQNLNNPDKPFNRFNGEVRERFLIDSGDLLFAWSGTPGTSFGAHVWTGGPAVLNQHIFNVKFDRGSLDREFFRHAINQKLNELIDKAHGGVGLRHVTKGKFEETKVSLPPLPEQRRIVRKLDTLSARTTTARTHLTAIAKLVERYRNSVLEREFGALQEFKNLGDLVAEGPTNGFSPSASTDGSGTLSLKQSATTTGAMRLDPSCTKRVIAEIDPSSKYWLVPGDVLIQRANSLPYLGATAIFDGPEKTYIYPDLMMRVRVGPDLDRNFLWYFLNSPKARSYFVENATGTAGNMPKINGRVVKSTQVPWVNIEKQREIVRRIEAAFAKIDRLAVEAEKALKLSDRLDQRILAKAFAGELVPQDPTDEPATELLARIREARAIAPKPKRGRRKKEEA